MWLNAACAASAKCLSFFSGVIFAYTIFNNVCAVFVPSNTEPSGMVTPPVTASMFCRNSGSIAITPSHLDAILYGPHCTYDFAGTREVGSEIHVADIRAQLVGEQHPLLGGELHHRLARLGISISETNGCKLRWPPCTVITPSKPVKPPEGRASALACARIR